MRTSSIIEKMGLMGFIISSLLFSSFAYVLTLFRRRKLPPGPIGLPIVGNLFNIGPKPHESLAKLAQKHGPLMTICLGSVTNVVASSAEMAREILQKNDEACSGRFVPDAVTALHDYGLAVVWMSTGQRWRMIRRALNIYLTNRQKLDTLGELRHKAVHEMVEHLKLASKTKEAVDIGKLTFTTALNQMSNTLVSKTVAGFDSQEDGVKGFLNAVKTIMVVAGKFNIADIFPMLKPLDPQNIRRKAKVAYGWLSDEICQGFIDERLKERVANVRRYGDLLDSLIDSSEENGSEFNSKYIKILLVDMFIAGTETNSNTTEWAMTELILHPDIMTKVRQEITESVQQKGRIEEVAILGLPYLQAVIKETMRLHLVVPLLIPHKTERSVKLNGYLIPKNTRVLVNAWAIARDPKYWDNPTCFMPERFLGSELDFKGKHFEFLPFSSGRRICSGIPLAQRMVSLMVASLVYHFDWKIPRGSEKLDMNDIFGLTLQRATPLVLVPTIIRELI